MLLTLRGTPFLYYGDEIALPDAELDPAEGARPGGAPHRRPEPQPRRLPHADAVDGGPGAGFTERRVEPWLPFGDPTRNVAAQREDPGSTLHLVRDLIALRRERADLRDGAYETLPAPDGAWAYRRGDGTVVALNLRTRRRRSRARGTVLIATDRGRDGEAFAGALRWRRGRRRGASMAWLDELLSDEGWPYASTPPVEEGDPGRFHALFGRDSLITSLQVLPARPDVARGTLRALAALQGRAEDPGTLEEQPGKIGHEFRDAAPERSRVGLAGRGPVRLLRHRRRDVVVPRAARGDRRRRARGGARGRVARGGRLARGRARSRRRPRPLRARPAGALDAAGLARRDRPDAQDHGGDPAGRRHRARAAAGRRRLAGRGLRRAAGARAAVGRGALGALAPRRCAERLSRLRARRRWPSSPTARAVPGAGSQLGWLLWADALDAGGARRGRRPAVRARHPDRLRPAHPVERRRPCSSRTPTTAARSGRSTPGSAGAACAPPAAREEAERVRTGVLAALDQLGRAPELYAVTRTGEVEPSRSPTACRRGPSAPAGRSRTGGTGGRAGYRPASGIGSLSSPTKAPSSSSISHANSSRSPPWSRRRPA